MYTLSSLVAQICSQGADSTLVLAVVLVCSMGCRLFSNDPSSGLIMAAELVPVTGGAAAGLICCCIVNVISRVAV
jgi:hypothetical protein